MIELTTFIDAASGVLVLLMLGIIAWRWRHTEPSPVRTVAAVLFVMVAIAFTLSAAVSLTDSARIEVASEYAQVLIPAIWVFLIYTAVDQVTRHDLRESERRFRRLVEGSWDVICLVSAKGEFTYSTENIKRVLGINPSDYPNYRLGDFTHPDYKARIQSTFAGLLNNYGATAHLEVKAQHANGEWRWLDIRCANMLDDPAVGSMVLTFRDITEQKQAQEYTERFRVILENTSDFVGMATPDGRALYINKAGRAMLGIGCDEDITGQPIQTFQTPESNKLIKQSGIPAARESGVWSGELEFLTRDGQIIPVSQVIVAHRDREDQITMFSTVARDITERKRAEQAILDSEHRYRILAESTPAGIWQINQDGTTVYANPAMCAMLEIDDPSELSSTSFHSFFTQESLNRMAVEHEKRIDGVSSSYEVEIIGRKGKKTIAIVSGAPYFQKNTLNGLVGTFVDITALRETQASLANERTFSTTAIESLPGLFYLFDEDGVMLRWSRRFEEVTGLTEDEVRARTPVDYFAPAHREAVAHMVQEVFEQGESNVEADLIAKDGRPMPYFFTGRYMLHEGKHCVIGTGVDITEQKKLEEQLRHAQKMESIGQLAGGVAHDFNNLLVAINGYSDVILETLPNEDPMRADVEEIRNAGERAASLTRQLLAFSRRQVLQPKVFDLNASVQSMERILRRLIGEHVELICDLAPNLQTVKADPGQFEQIIVNLAVNARDAMAEGGRLTFTTSNVAPGEAAIQRLGHGDYVCLSVSDTGCGMDQSTLEKIFEPFFTTKGREQGTGLGLAMVFGIVKQSGGDIRVQSVQGSGTTFSIYLPAATEPADKAVETEPSAEPHAQGRETIVVAEDDDMSRSLLTRVLRSKGYRVLEAPNGRRALEMIQSYKGEIALLITDVVMPFMSGYELAETVTTMRPRIHVMFVSGYVDDAIVEERIRASGWPLIHKPFTPKQMTNAVHDSLTVYNATKAGSLARAAQA